MTEHKWARILRAMADGEEVEFYHVGVKEWFTPGEEEDNPITCPDWEWRIKPVQEKPMPTPHIHAAKMAEYAQDAAIDGEAWKNWECHKAGRFDWCTLQCEPFWYTDREYRRKLPAQKMLKVTTNSGKVLEFPEPMKTAPDNETAYFLVDSTVEYFVMQQTWVSDATDLRWLSLGICHLTREATEKHAAALLAVSRGE